MVELTGEGGKEIPVARLKIKLKKSSINPIVGVRGPLLRWKKTTQRIFGEHLHCRRFCKTLLFSPFIENNVEVINLQENRLGFITYNAQYYKTYKWSIHDQKYAK